MDTLLKILLLESVKYTIQVLSLRIDFKRSTSKYKVNRYKQIQEAKERWCKEIERRIRRAVD